MTKKGFCVGHLVVEEKLNARLFVFIYKTITYVQDEVKYKYNIKVTFLVPSKFSEISHLLSTSYMSKNLFDWEMGVLREQILPELNRLKSVGFMIDESGIGDLMSELV